MALLSLGDQLILSVLVGSLVITFFLIHKLLKMENKALSLEEKMISMESKIEQIVSSVLVEEEKIESEMKKR